MPIITEAELAGYYLEQVKDRYHADAGTIQYAQALATVSIAKSLELISQRMDSGQITDAINGLADTLHNSLQNLRN